MLEHGGNLREAQRRYGGGDWIDLSTGINPIGYPAPPLAPDAWQRLPEPDPALLNAACAYYGARAMLPVAGTQAAIQALPRLRAPSRVTVAAPSYAEHAHHWSQHGHALRQIGYPMLDAAVGGSDVVVVCNPNNPTGATVPPAVLLGWAAELGARGGWLVVDEAFGDTAPALSVAAHAGQPGWSCCARSANSSDWPGCGWASSRPRRRCWPRWPTCSAPGRSAVRPSRSASRRCATPWHAGDPAAAGT
jgi:cobalamin biosynthetic protein CobC